MPVFDPGLQGRLQHPAFPERLGPVQCTVRQTEAQEVLPEHEEELLPSEGDRALERFPREAVDSPSLEIFKTCLDKILCSLL